MDDRNENVNPIDWDNGNHLKNIEVAFNTTIKVEAHFVKYRRTDEEIYVKDLGVADGIGGQRVKNYWNNKRKLETIGVKHEPWKKKKKIKIVDDEDIVVIFERQSQTSHQDGQTKNAPRVALLHSMSRSKLLYSACQRKLLLWNRRTKRFSTARLRPHLPRAAYLGSQSMPHTPTDARKLIH
jgi:hypothetical protein